MKLPKMFAPLFRNYQIGTIDPKQHIDLIVKTALVHGAWDHILWLFEYYGSDRISEVFLEDFYGMRELPEPVVNLWGLLFLSSTDYWMERKARESEVRTFRGRRSIVSPEGDPLTSSAR